MSSAPEQPAGFDLDAHAWQGWTYRELIEFLTGAGAKLTFFWDESGVEADLRELLSPTNFLRLLCERGGDSFYVAESPEVLAARLPFLAPEEVQAMSKRFGRERVQLPTPFNIIRTYRRMMIVDLFMKGGSTRSIAHQVRCSDRYVRYVTQYLERPEPHG